jgi:hypothetical protein
VSRRVAWGCVGLALSVFTAVTASAAPPGTPRLHLGTPIGLPLADSGGLGAEPRAALLPDGQLAAISLTGGSAAGLWLSHTGGQSWGRPRQTGTGSQKDQDLVSTATGRLVAVSLGDGNTITTMNVVVSDDQGKTWTPSTGVADATTSGLPDRPWLAADPHDPQRVALIFENQTPSPAGDYQVFIQISKDGGKTFAAAQPTLKKFSPVWWSIQCGEIGGAGGIAFSPTGDITVTVPGRPNLVNGDGPGGACADLPPSANVVRPTQVWAVTADRTLKTWTPTLALDGTQGAGHILCVQFCPPAYDDAGTLYLATIWTPSTSQLDATLGYVYRKPGDRAFHPMTTVSAPGQARLMPDIIAGAPGRIAFASMSTASPTTGSSPWIGAVDIVTHADSPSPTLSRAQAPQRVIDVGTSIDEAGAQTANPTGTASGPGRFSDNFGMVAGRTGAVTVIFTSGTGVVTKNKTKAPPATLDSFSVTETSGPRLR